MDSEKRSDLARLSADARASQLIAKFHAARERRESLDAALELASHFIHGGRHQQAAQALEIAREYAKGVEAEARLCRLKANLLYRQGHFSEAAGLLERMASHPDIKHYPLALFGIRMEQARVCFRQGYLEKARDFVAEAEIQLSAWQGGQHQEKIVEAEEDLAWADLYHIKALLDGASGNHQSALTWYDREIEILERQEAKDRLGPVYNNLSGLFKIRGSFYEALEYQQKAHRIAEESQDLLSLAISHNNLAEIFYDLGDYAAAEENYRRYLALNRRIDNRLGDTFGLAGLGRIARDGEEFDRAEDYFQQALTAARQVNSPSRQASILTELAELYCLQGRCRQAEQTLNQAVALCLETQSFNSQRHQLLEARIRLEAAGLKEGQDSEELDRLEKLISGVLSQPLSQDDEEPVSEPDIVREGYHLLARVQHQLGKKEQAKNSWRRAWETVEEVLSRLPQERKEPYLRKPEIRRLKMFQENL